MTCPKRLSGELRFFATIVAIGGALGFWSAGPAGAQETGQLRVNLGPGGERGVFMISCIRDGAVVFQTEGNWGSGPLCMMDGATDIPVGVYDVRVEGRGVFTQEKRGVLVTPGNPTNLHFMMESGEGVRTVEYSTSAAPREEIVLRLEALEATVRQRIAALEEQVAELIRMHRTEQG